MHKRTIISLFLAILIAFVILAGTFLFWKAKQEEVFNSQKNAFSESTNFIINEISNRLNGYELILSGVKAFYENSTFVTRNEYINYIKTINFDLNGNGLLAISLVEFVPGSELHNHIAFMGEQGYENYQITPKGQRDHYAPITYIYPDSPDNLKAVGFDLLTKASVNASLYQSRDTGLMAMTGRMTLVQDYQDMSGNHAKVIYVPIYNTEKPIETISDRKEALSGWVSAPFRFKDLMATIPNPADDGINLDIYEGQAIDKGKHLYGNGTSHSIKASDALLFASHTIEVGGKHWTLGFSTLPSFSENLNAYTHHWILVLGTAFSIFAGWLLWLIGLGRDKAVVLAEEMTKDLRLHAKVFQSSQEGFFVTDELNKIISVNHGFTQITGYTSEEAIGKPPSMLSSGRQDKAFYREMWTCLKRDKYWQGELWNRRKSGVIYPEWLSISAVVDDKDQIKNYVCVFSDLSEKKNAEEAIHNLMYFDKLTGLPNRQLLLDRIKQSIEDTDASKSYYALLYIDVDDFKQLNESMGYGYGDLFLMEIANRIQAAIDQTYTVARIGSDEFVVLVPAIDEKSELALALVKELAENIFKAIKQPFDLNSYQYLAKVSIGVSLFGGEYARIGLDRPDQILKLADIAMSQAKKTGRDKIHFYDQEMQTAFENRVLLESSLRQAIPSELELYYQVQVDSNDNVFGAEALIRWHSKEHGFVSPANFIPIAEESGLILQIGQWVIDSACKQLKAWEAEQNTRELILAINISPKQFSQDDFVQQVIKTVDQVGINPDRLKLEITEGILVDDINAAIEKMKLLQAKGIRFSLDDFGTGYSSLTYLKRLPLNQLKIDRSFVSNIDIEPADKAIASTIVTLGNTLGLNVIAEGVETSSQRETLIECGCYLFQGYYFSKPLAIADFQKFINTI